MATNFLWSPPDATVTVFTSQLDTLGNGSFSAASAAILNETDSTNKLRQYLDLELVLAALSPATGAFVDVWIGYTLDGTNFADLGKPLQVSAYLTTFQLDTAAATAQRIIQANVIIAPLDFKLMLRNMAGVSFGTGNTLKIRRHFEQGL